MASNETAEQILARLELFGVRQGLQHTRPLLAALGNPQAGLPTVLVAGTNGKGSTAALIAAMARAAGYRCGLYTSPHLETVTERIVIDGRQIEAQRLVDLLQEVLAQSQSVDSESADSRTPTLFEALTLTALLYFRRELVDLAVLEVGLGGRMDTTNLSEPMISVITRIGLDHEAYLGNTLAQIATEKAGIFRPGRPALVWAPQAEVATVFESQAAATGCELERVDREVRIEPDGSTQSLPQRATLRTSDANYRLRLHLAGRHQLDNLALAVRSAERLAQAGFSALGKSAIATGAERCRWPGRLEWVVLPRVRVLLDGAHNPVGIEALADYLDSLGQPIDLLFGALADKKIEQMLPPLAKRCRKIWLTEPRSENRAGGMRQAIELLGPRAEGHEPEVAKALPRALEGSDGQLLVCGSLFLVGEARSLLRQQYGVPTDYILIDGSSGAAAQGNPA